jgi:hypothetical protein
MKKKARVIKFKPERREEVQLDFFEIKRKTGADFLDIKIADDKLTINAGLITPGCPQILNESKAFTYELLKCINDPEAHVVAQFRFFREVAFCWKPRKEYR